MKYTQIENRKRRTVPPHYISFINDDAHTSSNSALDTQNIYRKRRSKRTEWERPNEMKWKKNIEREWSTTKKKQASKHTLSNIHATMGTQEFRTNENVYARTEKRRNNEIVAYTLSRVSCIEGMNIWWRQQQTRREENNEQTNERTKKKAHEVNEQPKWVREHTRAHIKYMYTTYDMCMVYIHGDLHDLIARAYQDISEWEQRSHRGWMIEWEMK